MNRRGFTLIELLVAGMMATIVLGTITLSLSQLGSSKSISRQRLEAHSRCDLAMRTIRKDIITTLRRGDLFYTRVLITDATHRFDGEIVNNDELLLFDGSLRANKEIDFNGEGMEYETQFRIESHDEFGTALWKRRDAILDDNPIGGGMATPISTGVIALELEAFDGTSWFSSWDTDDNGMPHAIRITVTTSGMNSVDEESPLVTLRTVVPIDRYQSPDDKLVQLAEEAEAARLAALGIDVGDGQIDLDSGGGSGGDSGDSENSGGSGGKDEGKPSNGGGTTIIVDPDGNEHEIPIGP